MLNRFLRGKQEELGVVSKAGRGDRKRPWRTSEVDDVAAADRYRSQVLREIGAKVLEIQNASLGEAELRDMNDAINKLIKEKSAWERRVAELGGPRYKRDAATDGAPSRGDGYRYFGAAKNLPGVKELFDAPAPPAKKRHRGALLRGVDATYYGFFPCQASGLAGLRAAEGAAQARLTASASAAWSASAEATADHG